MPIDFETIDADLSETAKAWALQERDTGEWVYVPHAKYPGRRPIFLFLRHEDAIDFLQELLEENDALNNKGIYVTEVDLKLMMQRIASGSITGIDSYAVYSPNEVYEWLHKDRRQTT